MAAALSENPASAIHSLNLAHNTLDNQGTNLNSEFFLPQVSSDRSLAFSWLVLFFAPKASQLIPVHTEA